MPRTFPLGSGHLRSHDHCLPDSSTPIKKHKALLTLKYSAPKFGPTGKLSHVSPKLEGCQSPLTQIPVESEKASVKPATEKVPRSRTPSKKAEVQPLPLDQLTWLTLKQAALRWPSFTEKSLRHTVSQAEAYKKYPQSGLVSNGFIDCIVRPAGQRKIILNAEKFEQWLKSFSVAAKWNQ